MPHINELKDSKYLRKEDAGRGILVTVKHCQQENVAMQGQAPEMKWVLYFNETNKGMVLNTVNGQLIAQALGGEHTDQWIGKQIVLYNEPSIIYGNKVTGGIRARAPKGPQPSQMHSQPYQQSHLPPSQQPYPPPGPLQPYTPPPAQGTGPGHAPAPMPPPEQPYQPGQDGPDDGSDIPF